MLILARPELLSDHQALVRNRRVTVVHLEPLTSPEMSRLLEAMIVGVPRERSANELIARAEGIPLYAIETVRALVDQQIVVPRDGQYVLADADAADLGALTAPVEPAGTDRGAPGHAARRRTQGRGPSERARPGLFGRGAGGALR